MKRTEYSKYTSPFSWRYGSDAMRRIFSEENKYRLWRRIWVELARAQHKLGLVSKEELEDLEKNQEDLDIERIWEIEKDTKHDVVAAIKEFAQKAKVGGGKIHLGATSMDIVDNAETIRISDALKLVENELINLLKTFGKQIEKYSDTVCMGYTHLQPAEPTTLGYRFAFYAQDLLMDFDFLQFVKKHLKSKGIRGAVGTSASFVSLMGEKKAEEMELGVLGRLGIEAADITSQTAPRKVEVWLGNLFASIAQSLYKFAFDLRVMQSSGFGEWQEPFGTKQVGSSAMPFKKNPIKAEQICSLARLVVNLSKTTWDNASLTLLERTLDDSANRRVVIPEMFLAIDEILTSSANIVEGLVISDKQIMKNLDTYWTFSASETIILEAVKKGADRQTMHEVLREISMKAWEAVGRRQSSAIEQLLLDNKEVGKYLSRQDLRKILDASGHVGNAPQKALTLVEKILKI